MNAARPPMPSTPDAHNQPSPTLEERLETFESAPTRLIGSIVAVAVLVYTLAFTLIHWTR